MACQTQWLLLSRTAASAATPLSSLLVFKMRKLFKNRLLYFQLPSLSCVFCINRPQGTAAQTSSPCSSLCSSLVLHSSSIYVTMWILMWLQIMELWGGNEKRTKRERPRKKQENLNTKLPEMYKHCLSRYPETICRSHANEPMALLTNLLHLDVALRKNLMETPDMNTEGIVPLVVFHPFCFCYQF